MGCGSSTPTRHDSVDRDLPSTSWTSQASYNEREKQRLLSINKERPMAWLFKYPDPHSPAPPSVSSPRGAKRTPDSSYASTTGGRSYMSKNSRGGFSTQNSYGSGGSSHYADAQEEAYVDPYLPGPYIQPMQPLHVGKGRARR